MYIFEKGVSFGTVQVDKVKEAAYKGLVRPVLDYGSSVWDPQGVVLQEELESVQKRAARFVTGNYNCETRSMTGILGQLKWESLKKRSIKVLKVNQYTNRWPYPQN